MKKTKKHSTGALVSSRSTSGRVAVRNREVVHGPGGRRLGLGPAYTVQAGNHLSGKDGKLRVIENRTGNVVKELGDIPTEAMVREIPRRGGPDEPLPDN